MTQFKAILLGFIFILIGTIQGLAQTEAQSQYIYVCNQGSASVSVIDATINELIATVDFTELGFSENAMPHHAVAEPDGSYWYVTLIGENRVLKFNRENELIGQAELEVPGLMAMHPADDILYVGRSMSAVNPPQSFGIVERSTMELLDERGLFFTRPHAIATTPDGSWTFVGSLSENQILSTNTETEESNLVNIPGTTHTFINFAVTPDGNTMIATGQVSGQLLFFDISDPLNPRFTNSVEVGAMPWHPVISEDGKYAYFANKQDNSVSVVNLDTQTVEATIDGEGLAQPHGAVLSLDGKYLYVSNNNLNGSFNPEGREDIQSLPGTVVIINTESKSIERVIEVGRYASGIGTNAR
jgi:YVTN family beta-propeller protein